MLRTGLNSGSSAPTGCAFPLKKQLYSPSQGSSPDDDDFNLCSVRRILRLDLRFIPCGTRHFAKAPLDVTTGGGLEGWSSFGVDCDELEELLENAVHQPKAIGINLTLSGVVCLDCDEQGWLDDLAELAETSAAELRKSLGS